MKVLIACEFSGVVRDAFLSKGHDAVSCDLLPTESDGPHIQDDVLNHLNGWDLIVAHPPCTYLCNSGVRWLYNKDGSRNMDRWRKMECAANFFRVILDTPCPRIAIENPVMHKHAKAIISRDFDFSVQPWQFGHGEVKRTCFWVRGLLPLAPTNVVDGRDARVHKCPPSKDRWKKRSITYTGLAEAMAVQWG